MLLASSCAINKNNTFENQIYKEDHFNQLESMDHWLIEGKIGYRDSKGGGSVKVAWSQNKENFEIELSGPFGINAKKIQGNLNHTKMQSDYYHISVPQDSGIYQKKTITLGAQIKHLKFWIKGMSSPSLTNIESEYNDDGTLTSLKQSGWKLDFSDYKNIGEFKLPNRIKGKKGVYEFNLNIKKWVIK